MNPLVLHTDDRAPSISHVEPVLVVDDVVATVQYWKDVLGFPNGWTFGQPVNHGGVSWNGGGFIQFGLKSNQSSIPMGQSVWVRARNLHALYELHHTNNADITSAIEKKPWGYEEYAVRELNGYTVYFSAPASERDNDRASFPADISVQLRCPSAGEYVHLMKSVGWPVSENEYVLNRSVIGAVAENTVTGQIIGSVLVLGDQVGFYYIKDLVVDPAWQGKRVGKALMTTVMNWLKQNAPDGATVGLFTGYHLANFYRQFGFIQCCGMYQQILKER